MYVEIGGFIKKGLGQGIVKKFSKNKSVLNVGTANGRATDLFDIQEFGEYGESEILTMIVDEHKCDNIFEQLYKFLDLKNKKQGVIFVSAPIVKTSV